MVRLRMEITFKHAVNSSVDLSFFGKLIQITITDSCAVYKFADYNMASIQKGVEQLVRDGITFVGWVPATFDDYGRWVFGIYGVWGYIEPRVFGALFTLDKNGNSIAATRGKTVGVYRDACEYIGKNPEIF